MVEQVKYRPHVISFMLRAIRVDPHSRLLNHCVISQPYTSYTLLLILILPPAHQSQSVSEASIFFAVKQVSISSTTYIQLLYMLIIVYLWGGSAVLDWLLIQSDTPSLEADIRATAQGHTFQENGCPPHHDIYPLACHKMQWTAVSADSWSCYLWQPCSSSAHMTPCNIIFFPFRSWQHPISLENAQVD